MRNYWSNIPSYNQPSVSELRRRAEVSVSSARRKGQIMEPAIPQTRSGPVCQSWWGQAWCQNLERYADYSTRLERGRRYIRSGTVLDLKIRKGRIEARVQGSRRAPYKVEIRISPLSEEKCQMILEKCGRRIRTMEDLIYGRFPEELKELFTQEDGLFPRPTEISFMCSCPDWALMCKHVAAAMYGVGLRLDENPFYFFELRGVEVDRFIDVALDNKVERMLDNASVMTSRIMETDDLMDLFGVLGPEAAFPALGERAAEEQDHVPAIAGDGTTGSASRISEEARMTPAGEPDTLPGREAAGYGTAVSGSDDLIPGLPGREAADHGRAISGSDDLMPGLPGRETAGSVEQAGDKDACTEVEKAGGEPSGGSGPESGQQESLPLPGIIFQGGYGREISREEILERVSAAAPDADHIYIKPADNRAYWTAGEKAGFIELW